MTVKELKNCFSKFSLKPKISVPDDREITNEDIEQGKIFQKFMLGNSLVNTVDGLGIDEGAICYFYTSLERIEIITEDFFPACGGEQELYVYGHYSIKKYNVNGEEVDFITDGECKVNAIVKLDNTLFTYEKPNIVNRQPNNSDINNEVNINASYYFKGVKYTALKHVIQHINTNSSWLVEKEPTNFISITLSENNVSNKGGIVLAKVERTFSRMYFKQDSCGNKIGEKCETGLTEDITEKCLITSSNKKQFSVSKNIITVKKQQIGAKERECVITARYSDKTATAILKQNQGGQTSYVQELSFSDGSKAQFLNIETSLPTKKIISIISKEHKYIDGEYDSSYNTDDIKIQSDSNWLYGGVIENEDGINILINITNANLDKHNDREAIITISNNKNPSLAIKLIVSQQYLDVIKESYSCTFVSDGKYTFDELDKTDFYFHPYKILTYENGETEEVKINEHINFKYNFISSNEKLLNINSIYKKEDDYYVKFNNLASHSMTDIELSLKLIFYGENHEKLFESDKANIIVKGNEIIDYNYELCFENHNKFENVSWTNSKEPILIKINSLKHKLINGKYSGKEITPFKIGYYDDNGKETFDKNFSIKIANDEIIVFPINTDSTISRTYTVTQKETGDKIYFNLTYNIKKNKFKLPLQVIVYSNNVGKDIWTGENGYMLIDGNDKIKLNPCWLSPNMKDNVDVSYNGMIDLEEGKHVFETFNVLCLDYNSKTHKDCNVYKEINVNKDTKNIVIQIKI